jgi:uncharacterized protein YbjT (DUF2867 family)
LNWVGPWFRGGLDEGKLMIALAPTTRLQMIAVEDVGKYGLLAFEPHEELAGKASDLAGDALSMPEVAETIGRVAGRRIELVRLPIDEVRKASADYATMLE